MRLQQLGPVTLSLAFVLAVGCGSPDDAASTSNSDASALPDGPVDDSAEAAVRYIMEGVKNGQPVVAWNALPERYQNDLNGVVRGFGETMDPEIWKQVTETLGNVQKILVDKEEFILNHPAVSANPNADSVKSAVPQMAALFGTIIDASSDLEALKTFDGGQFMTSTGASVLKQIDTLQKLAPPGSTPGPVGLAAISDVKIETLSTTDDTATLQSTGPDGRTEKIELVRVEGKWLPKDMAEKWDQEIANAQQALKTLPETLQQMKPQVAMMTGVVNGALTPLQSAATQEQFNDAVQGVQGMVMGLVMSQMGNMGQGPPGFPSQTNAEPESEGSPGESSPPPQQPPAPQQ